MAEPLDVSGYVDLTLYDVDAETIKARALADAVTKFPDWEPVEGNTEVAIIEAQGVEVDELVFAVNRLPGAITELVLRLYSLTRDPGAPATGTVTLTLSDTAGHTIPAGTRFLLNLGPDVDPVELLTDVDLVVAPGAGTADVDVTATGDPSANGNGTPAGTAVDIVDAVPYVDAATLASALGNGRDPEDGPMFLDRGTARLGRLVTTIVHPDDFTASALEEPYVEQAVTVDRYDPAQVPPENRNGHVTLAVTGPGGAALSGPNKAALTAKLAAAALATLTIHLADATITDVDVDTTFTVAAGNDPTVVAAAVLAALDAYINPDVWPFTASVYRNELIALVDRTPGVDRVVTLTINGGTADVALTGVGPLANLGAGSTAVAV